MGITFERLPQLLAKRGRSRASHYADIQRGLWTRPVALGPRCAGWPSAETEIQQAARLRGATADELRELVADLHEARKRAA
ncbi:MAG: AlpA family phage regulatory protein [Zoogloeaceae bacterium]|nr:AlpA family phage regulatory protein [Zoogloeaceae bacterium]